ncbi:hypothetical protein JYK22_26990, partial [Nonomuraea sp. RK-328]|nr:hypothetical protein [Nonomuraea sp. RK-328]
VVLALLTVLVVIERDGAEDETPRPDHVVTASCPKMSAPDLTRMPRQRLPFDFVAAQVIRCRWEPRYLPGKGVWEVVIQEHADGAVDELMTELRRPSEESLFPPMCTFEAILVDYFVLVDASGRAVLPRPPTGVCGKPFPSALEALHRLPYRVDGQVPIRRIESEKSYRAGCGDEHPDVLRRVVQGASVRRPWNPPPEGLRVCVFRTSGKTAHRPGPFDLPTGRLESSRILTGGGLRTVLAALDAAPPSDCRGRHTRFAVMAVGPSAAYAELDGCHNVLRPDGALGRLSPEVVKVLTASRPSSRASAQAPPRAFEDRASGP